MKKIIGDPTYYFETGSGGMLWAVEESGKEGYEALNFIEVGDHLKVYGPSEYVLFDGEIEPDYEAGWMEYPNNPGHGQPMALGYYIHWTQKGWTPEGWASLFVRKNILYAELTKKEKEEKKEDEKKE